MWARLDEPVQVLAMIGLTFLLLLAGLEVAFDRLCGEVLRPTSVALDTSFALAMSVGNLLHTGGLVQSPLLIAVILSASSPEGRTNREIGERLDLSHPIVGSHLYRMFRRWGHVPVPGLDDRSGRRPGPAGLICDCDDKGWLAGVYRSG